MTFGWALVFSAPNTSFPVSPSSYSAARLDICGRIFKKRTSASYSSITISPQARSIKSSTSTKNLSILSVDSRENSRDACFPYIVEDTSIRHRPLCCLSDLRTISLSCKKLVVDYGRSLPENQGRGSWGCLRRDAPRGPRASAHSPEELGFRQSGVPYNTRVTNNEDSPSEAIDEVMAKADLGYSKGIEGVIDQAKRDPSPAENAKEHSGQKCNDIQTTTGTEKAQVLIRSGHPLLRNWNPPLSHKFTEVQKQTLTAICDTLCPSLEPPSKSQRDLLYCDGCTDSQALRTKSDEDLKDFYRLSASDAGVPADVYKQQFEAEGEDGDRDILVASVHPLGTFLLSGRASLSKNFPYFQKFVCLSRVEQERVLQIWSKSSLSIFRGLFKLFKAVTLWVFYCKVDANGYNRAWNAIGYCGPDPSGTCLREGYVDEKRAHLGSIRSPRTLGDKVIDAKSAGDNLSTILELAGCDMMSDTMHLKTIMDRKKRWGSVKGRDIGIRCDVVVVGSGSGGGVVAAVLAKAGYKVVVLEKGQYFAPEDITTLEGPSQMAMYEKFGALATEDGSVNFAVASTVGGGSTVNWSACFKTPENVLKEWVERFGLDLFSSEKYKQAMQLVWQRLSVQTAVNKENLPNWALREGCKKLGLEVGTLARNAGPDHYCGWCTYGCRTGEKQSVSETWLADAVNTNNAIILSECKAEAVLLSPRCQGNERKQARAVVARIGEGPNRIIVEARATVVACGSLMMTPLLLNSGLRNPNIGKNLRIHPVFCLWGYFPEGSGCAGTCYEGGIVTAFSPLMAKGPQVVEGLLETMSFHPGAFVACMPWCSGAEFKDRMVRYPRTVTLCVVTKDNLGSGSVGVDANGEPSIDYTLSAFDEEPMMVGAEQGLRVLIAAGAVEVGTHQHDGERLCVEGASPSEIEAYLARVRSRGAKKLKVTIASAHQMSSCQMGLSPKTSVVDSRGETWEARGLFLGDASVFPTALGVNPMITIQSIAHCTAQSVVTHLKEEIRVECVAVRDS